MCEIKSEHTQNNKFYLVPSKAFVLHLDNKVQRIFFSCFEKQLTTICSNLTGLNVTVYRKF